MTTFDVSKVTNAELSAVVRAAAQRIAEKGRCTGVLWDLPPGHTPQDTAVFLEVKTCLHGALYTEIRNKFDLWELDDFGHVDLDVDRVLHDRIVDVMRPLLPEMPNPQWANSIWPGGDLNDHEDTTDEDVQKLLLQVADRLEVL